MSLSSMLYAVAGAKLLLPYYHLVSDDAVPHVRQLYRYKTVADFERDLDALLRDFHPISLDELLDAQLGSRGISRPSFHLSFDDGFSEMESIVAPILRRRGVPATFFVCSAFVDNRCLARDAKVSLLADAFAGAPKTERVEVWRILHASGLFENAAYDISPEQLARDLLAMTPESDSLLDELQELLGLSFSAYLRERRPYLDSEALKNLHAQGFSIGAHSVDHPRYDCLSYQDQLRQTYESLSFLGVLLGLRYRAFAFPYSDRGVSERFLLETKNSGLLDLSFGTGGMTRSPVAWHFQRLSFEKPPIAAERILRSATLRSIAKRVLKAGQAVKGI